MPIRRIIAYWLLILLPSFAIGGLALYYVSHENDLVVAQQRASLSDQGRRAAEDILLLVDNLQNGMVLTLESLPDEERVASLRRLEQVNPLVRATFLFDLEQDRVSLPDARDLENPSAQNLVRRYDALFSGRVPWFAGENGGSDGLVTAAAAPTSVATGEAMQKREGEGSQALRYGNDLALGSQVRQLDEVQTPSAPAPAQMVQAAYAQQAYIENGPPMPNQPPAPQGKTVDLASSGKGNLFRQLWNESGPVGRNNSQVLQEKLGDKGSLYYEVAGKQSRPEATAPLDMPPPGATSEREAFAFADGAKRAVLSDLEAGSTPPLGAETTEIPVEEKRMVLAAKKQREETPALDVVGGMAKTGRQASSTEPQMLAGRVGAAPPAPVVASSAPQPPRPPAPPAAATPAPSEPSPAVELSKQMEDRSTGADLPQKPVSGSQVTNRFRRMSEESAVGATAGDKADKDLIFSPETASVPVSKPIPLAPLRYGWKPWHWENSFYLLGFVFDAARRQVFGVELELLALLSRLPAALDGGTTAAYLLRDQQGTTYFQSRLMGLGEVPADVFNLGPALPFYELAVFPADPAGAARLGRSSFLAMALLVGVFLAAIASGGGLLIMQARSSWREAMQKTSFVSNVSHELKTPLTTLRMYTEMLRGGKLAPEKQRQYLDVMLTEGERLSRLVGNVLDFSRLEQGRKKYQLERTDLNALTAALVESSRVAFERPDLCVTFVPAARPLFSRIDADAVEQIVLNLLDNAAKYGAGGGEIRVTLGEGPRGFRISVLDRGPGIPRAHREKIFDKFHRVDESLTASQGGCGLGLSIARRLARDLGGELTHEERPGGGAAFHLDLPADKEPAA